MQIVFVCPRCERPRTADVADAGTHGVPPASGVSCEQCGWSSPHVEGALQDGKPVGCLVCGCDDLWRQKDFPAALGLMLVGIGALLSTVAWSYYRPVLAIGILMGFGLLDLLLFLFMDDVLVCYRCGARHRHPPPDESIPKFDLEVAERYRQEAARLRERAGS